MKTFKKIYSIRFYWISNTKVRFTLLKFFEARLEIPKITKHGLGGPNNSRGGRRGRGGRGGFLSDKREKNEAFIRDLRVGYSVQINHHCMLFEKHVKI